MNCLASTVVFESLAVCVCVRACVRAWRACVCVCVWSTNWSLQRRICDQRLSLRKGCDRRFSLQKVYDQILSLQNVCLFRRSLVWPAWLRSAGAEPLRAPLSESIPDQGVVGRPMMINQSVRREFVQTKRFGEIVLCELSRFLTCLLRVLAGDLLMCVCACVWSTNISSSW